MANMIGLKYISIQKLGEFFDSFTARKPLTQLQIDNREYQQDESDDDVSLNQIQIQSFIDTNNNEEAIE